MRVSRGLVGIVAIGCLLTASPPADASSGRSTRVTVEQLGFADFGVSPTVVQARLPKGFVARPCFSGQAGSADVLAFVTSTHVLDLAGVDPHEEVRAFFLLTCATPPARFVRDDATEPPYFLLGAWADSDAYRHALDPHGDTIRPAVIDLVAPDDQRAAPAPHAFRFTVTDAVGSTLADGAFSTPALPTPLAPCASLPTSGRSLGVTNNIVTATDFTKVESTCLGGGTFTWSAGTALDELVGRVNAPIISGVSFVASEVDRFLVLGSLGSGG